MNEKADANSGPPGTVGEHVEELFLTLHFSLFALSDKFGLVHVGGFAIGKCTLAPIRCPAGKIIPDIRCTGRGFGFEPPCFMTIRGAYHDW